jgi:hypothetical protein
LQWELEVVTEVRTNHLVGQPQLIHLSIHRVLDQKLNVVFVLQRLSLSMETEQAMRSWLGHACQLKNSEEYQY